MPGVNDDQLIVHTMYSSQFSMPVPATDALVNAVRRQYRAPHGAYPSGFRSGYAGLPPLRGQIPGYAYDSSMPLKNFPRPGTARGMLDSRYHKYNKKLPGRYLSELSPNSMPLADAKVHLARARLAFQKKLRRLDTQFKLADDNGNGLMPPKGIIKCLERADIVLPDKYVKKIIAQSQLPDPDPSPMKEGDVYWRVVIGHLKRIKFNPNDGLDEVELALIAAEFASVFDADGDGIEAHEISAAFKSFDKDGDGDISTRELASVMRTLAAGPAVPQAPPTRRPVSARF